MFLFRGDFNMYFDTKLDADGGSPKLKVNSLTQLEIILEETIYVIFSESKILMQGAFHGAKGRLLNKEG